MMAKFDAIEARKRLEGLLAQDCKSILKVRPPKEMIFYLAHGMSIVESWFALKSFPGREAEETPNSSMTLRDFLSERPTFKDGEWVIEEFISVE